MRNIVIDVIAVAVAIAPIYAVVLLSRVLGRLDHIAGRLDEIAGRSGDGVRS